MEPKYNSQTFTPEEVKKGLHLDLINYLLDYNKKADDDFNDIHITTDGYCTTIEWTKTSYDGAYGGRFKCVDIDEVVMIEKIFPDNHIELCYDENDYEERLKEFLEENPGWERTEYGTWTNTIENEKIKKYLEGEK